MAHRNKIENARACWSQRKHENKKHSKITLLGKGSTEQIPMRRQNYDWILGKLECLSAFFASISLTRINVARWLTQ